MLLRSKGKPAHACWSSRPFAAAAVGEADATMAGLRRIYDSGVVLPLPFLTSAQLPPAALLADAREGWYLPSTAALHLVRYTQLRNKR